MTIDFWRFLLAVWDQWQGLITGGVIAVAMMLIERRLKRPLSWRLFAAIMAVAVFWACFAAWRDEHGQLEARTQELATTRLLLVEVRGDLKASEAANKTKQEQLTDLQLQLDKKPSLSSPSSPPPIIRVQAGPTAARTERAWLALSGLTTDLSAAPLSITVTISNTGQIPALDLRLSGTVSTGKLDKPVFYKRQTVHKSIPNGFSSSFTIKFDDWDAARLRDIQSGTVSLYFYLRVEYQDEVAKIREPLESCDFWVPAAKTFSDCID